MSPDLYLSDWSGGKEIVDRVEEIAKKKGVTMAQVSLAWVLAQDGKFDLSACGHRLINDRRSRERAHRWHHIYGEAAGCDR